MFMGKQFNQIDIFQFKQLKLEVNASADKPVEVNDTSALSYFMQH